MEMGNHYYINFPNKPYSNQQPRSMEITWTAKMADIENKLNNILHFKPDLSGLGNDVIFYANYDDLPPKISRFNFKEIKTVEDVTWKSIEFIYEGNDELHSQLLYKVEKKYWEIFLEDIQTILKEKWFLNKEIFKNASSHFQVIIKQISLLSNKCFENFYLHKTTFKNKIQMLDPQTIMYVKVISLAESYEEILTKIGVWNDIIDFDFNFKTLILPQKSLMKIISHSPWIIESIDTLESKDLKIINPKIDDVVKKILNQEVIFSLKEPDFSAPFIGVIDTGANLKGDLNKYIIAEKHLEENLISVYYHASIVTSLIIANDELNPLSPDGFGNFKVKLFELLGYSEIEDCVKVSYRHLVQKLIAIVKNNRNIKIWNLSLGLLKEPWTTKMSSLGNLLDFLANEYQVLFIVSAGNEREYVNNPIKSLNSPADSYNALSVGSVKYFKNRYSNYTYSSYSSIGIVSTFLKPEVSSFGGPFNADGKTKLVAIGEGGKVFPSFDSIKTNQGTSFSAPRITRLAGFLYKNGYVDPLEIKAKIINECILETTSNKSSLYGYVNPFKKMNNFDLTVKGIIGNNKPYFIEELNLKNVDKLSLVLVNNTNYNQLLGSEYSISDLQVDLVMIKKNWRNELIERFRGGKTTRFNCNTPDYDEVKKNCTKEKNNFRVVKFNPETKKRTWENKFFTSKKTIYNLNNEDNKLRDEYSYALRIRRKNLIPNELLEINTKEIHFAVSINLEGEKLIEKDFIKINENLINIFIKQEIEVEIE